jgi:hypothetical protein
MLAPLIPLKNCIPIPFPIMYHYIRIPIQTLQENLKRDIEVHHKTKKDGKDTSSHLNSTSN